MSVQLGRTGMVFLPPDPGRKHAHVAVLSHRGGGWYEAACMGRAKACRAGECRHTRGLSVRTAKAKRPVRQVAA